MPGSVLTAVGCVDRRLELIGTGLIAQQASVEKCLAFGNQLSIPAPALRQLYERPGARSIRRPIFLLRYEGLSHAGPYA